MKSNIFYYVFFMFSLVFSNLFSEFVGNSYHLALARSGHKNLENFDLRGADFRNSDLSGVNLNCAQMQRTDCRGANFTSAKCENANFLKARMQNTICTGASFCCAILRHANMRGAEIAGSDFTNADVRKVNFIETNYEDARYLHTAKRRGAIFIAQQERMQLDDYVYGDIILLALVQHGPRDDVHVDVVGNFRDDRIEAPESIYFEQSCVQQDASFGCTICMDEYVDTQIVAVFHCGHFFCMNCANMELTYCVRSGQEAACPICRQPAYTISEEHGELFGYRGVRFDFLR